MDIQDFLAPKILVVSGKGGVGKTTVSAALALVAARQGRQVCIAEVDQKGSLPRLLGSDEDLTYEPREIASGVWAMNIVPDEALREYLDVQYHMKRIARVFSSSHFVDYITATAPGLKDILVLGKIWYLEQGRTGPKFDTIIVDAPAAGHMLTFLSAPSGLSDAVKVGPVQRQAEWLSAMLNDPARTRVHLVTLAEEMPVSETVETVQALREKLDISVGEVFANALYQKILTPKERTRLDEMIEDRGGIALRGEAAHVGLRLEPEDLESVVGYARFLDARRKIQQKHLRRLKHNLDEAVLPLPFLFTAGVDLPGIETLADNIEDGVRSL